MKEQGRNSWDQINEEEIKIEEQNKGKRMKRIEDNLRDFGDNIESINIRVIGVQRKKKKRKTLRKFLKKS